MRTRGGREDDQGARAPLLWRQAGEEKALERPHSGLPGPEGGCREGLCVRECVYRVTGQGATWSSGWCSCPWQGVVTR